MIPTVSGHFFQHFPAALQPLFHSGILLATLSSVLLNLFFNGYQPDLRHQPRPLLVGPVRPPAQPQPANLPHKPPGSMAARRFHSASLC